MAGTTNGTPADDTAAWREERTEVADRRHRELVRRREREAAQARELIGRFIESAQGSGPAAEPLRARSFRGSATFRTPLRGWYLRRNRSVAVGTDGEFYVLSAPGGIRARLRGVHPEPSDPPLVLGAGGRDGESIDLADALQAVLDRATRSSGR